MELAGLNLEIMEKQIKGTKGELYGGRESLSLRAVEGINFVDFVHH